ncbi:hypothetical protein K461DRAFT_57676 [Myriangium duriaei CBS 260.36]|uniref:Xylanolytic transcriptional activator regulatory domain-containing protein n=1 Tax=Myriangium duriaei CBS 260.36 TaxID=1168546 RepID=A0A9P4IUR5_9PEZI|nr:hypothetical protein K461DRAFT_57676 [Myriangium duriaei CBS 260.36]
MVSDAVYAMVQSRFAMMVAADFNLHSNHAPLPNLHTFESWIHLCIQKVLPTIPMLHVTHLHFEDPAQWVLPLALAVAGCQLSASPNQSLAMLELLRQHILQTIVSDSAAVKPLHIIQASLVCAMCLVYGDNQDLKKQGLLIRAFLVLRTAFLFEPDRYRLQDQSESHETRWKDWVDNESAKRTAYCVWLFDCIAYYTCLEEPLLKLETGQISLPCAEVLWEAEDAAVWGHIQQYSSEPATMVLEFHKLHLEKRLDSTLGEFARILVIHALYHWTWSLARHYQNPLSHYTPTSEVVTVSAHPAFKAPIWPLDVGDFSRWRDSMCDSLDHLHWRAISVTGAQLGQENPVVLHCHLARIVILTPLREICVLTERMLQPQSKSAFGPHVRTMQRWVKRDGHKARLAMIHAGVLFWHIRRHTASGYYEPDAVKLATLALWAFSFFRTNPILGNHDLGQVDSPSSATSSSHLTSDSLELPCIHLDRPADDEIVQLYISNGSRMKAYIGGIWDVSDRQSPAKILREGARITKQLPWGVAKPIVQHLESLAIHCENMY